MHACMGSKCAQVAGAHHSPTVLAVVSTADDCAAGPPKLGGMLKPPAPGPPAPKLGNPGGLQATMNSSQLAYRINHEDTAFLHSMLALGSRVLCLLNLLPSSGTDAAWRPVAMLRCGTSTGAICCPVLQCTQTEAGNQATHMPPGAAPPLP